ncbi:MAG: hypothetical protein NVS2B16_01220 [Chloroflexota bacterium]
MESRDFDELIAAAQQTGRVLAALLDGATQEDIDLGRAIRNYPVWTLAFVAGAGALGGWWLARAHQSQAPAPEPPTPSEAARALLADAGNRLRERAQELVGPQYAAREYVDMLLPGGVEAEAVIEEAGAAARAWVDTVLEPKLKDGFDQAVSSLSRSRISGFLRSPRQDSQADDADGPPAQS